MLKENLLILGVAEGGKGYCRGGGSGKQFVGENVNGGGSKKSQAMSEPGKKVEHRCQKEILSKAN